MTDEEKATLNRFETRVRQMLLQYKQLQERNLQLQKACEEKTDALKQAQEASLQLRGAYDSLKMARMMEISNEDLKEAKARIERLVRKVDKCIALLGV
ncbi:MAG: hypothetical protein IJ722_07650 [Alloprevotella sp.]|nr:hypothetical protein [Alloprevotella sp.]